MNSLFLTANDETNKIVFRVMDGKAVCYCSHPSVLFCKNCAQMTRNVMYKAIYKTIYNVSKEIFIVNSWDSTPENFFEKDDLIGQTLFHKSRSHLLEIFKVLRSMENKRLDSLLTEIMDLQKKDDFENFGKTISQIANFDEVKKIDDKEELDQVGKRSDDQEEQEVSKDEQQNDSDENDQDEVFEDHNEDEEFDEENNNHDYEEDEIIMLRPSTTTGTRKSQSSASRKVHGGNRKSTPIKIDIIDGDNENIENVDVKVNKKSNEPISNKRNKKN